MPHLGFIINFCTSAIIAILKKKLQGFGDCICFRRRVKG